MVWATLIFVGFVCTDSTPKVQKMSSMLKLTGVLLLLQKHMLHYISIVLAKNKTRNIVRKLIALS